ncbi:uncharacterized protein LOC122279375 isoform X2 [Carya illinoinensis]|uniref:uncharacterized protein LOC122279375 isoform X2 n=1 Tax=Carya illinoinensis TaxID=32201 RepID=UPI001C71EC91|nr:uncharacterized protein LOC122279375 isoform X2 [Carya illinoinensis]
MGKAEDEHAVQPGSGPQSSDQNEQTQWCGGGGYGNCGFGWCFGGVRRLIGLRCLFVLLFATAAFLSAIFWLPPFLQFADQRDLDLDPKFKDHDIVASFYLKKPFYLLEDNISQLKEDIWNEIGFPNTKIVILSLEYKDGSNTTKVVFGVDPDAKYSEISQTTQSLIRESFAFLVLRQYSLRLTTSLFGEPFLFEVLKFPGGITIIPYQRAFLLQKVQILFNFTLNFSIYEIQSNFDELRSQLKSGLHLAPYELLQVFFLLLNGHFLCSCLLYYIYNREAFSILVKVTSLVVYRQDRISQLDKLEKFRECKLRKGRASHRSGMHVGFMRVNI